MKNFKLLLAVAVLSVNIWALPPQVEADRLFVKAKDALDSKDYATAVQSLSKAQKLGVKLPDTFSYHYGTALLGMGNYDEALKMLDSYLAQGSTAKFYKEALEKYNFAENRDYWIDKDTGLMWQDNEDAKTLVKTQAGAVEYCDALSLAGYSDWILPSKDQLITLSPKKSFLKNLKDGHLYWTNTYISRSELKNLHGEYASTFYGPGEYAYWVVSVNHAPMDNDKTGSSYVRCVRNSK